MIGMGKSISHTEPALGLRMNEEKDARSYIETLAETTPGRFSPGNSRSYNHKNHRCVKNTLSFCAKSDNRQMAKN